METYTIVTEDGQPISVFTATPEDKNKTLEFIAAFFGFNIGSVTVVSGNRMPEKYN